MAGSTTTSLKNPMLDIRYRTDYTAAEQAFSQLLKDHVLDLLEGRRQRLPILRKYPHDPARIGVIPMPPTVVLGRLGLSRLEELTWEALSWLQVDGAAGPITQTTAPDGSTIEVQTFITRYPGVIFDRVDHFPIGAELADCITWCLSRIQRQPPQGVMDRLLVAANLVLGLAELVQ